MEEKDRKFSIMPFLRNVAELKILKEKKLPQLKKILAKKLSK